MERYDNIVKSSEIRKLVDNKMYQKALTILETIDVNKVKILTDLSVYAEVYMQTEKYEEAKKLLMRIRAKSNSRRVIQQLIKLAIKTKDKEGAEEYYEEYLDVAPRDPERFVLRYRIDRMRGEDIEVLIDSLEQLKEYDYIEKWSYELAKLYHRAGMKDKCIRECSDIILWFGEGVIVEKAKMLKAIYTGEPKRTDSISAEKKKEVEREQEFAKTKDLTEIASQVNSILEEEEVKEEEKTMDTSAKMEKILENEEDFQYNHKSIQDIPNIGDITDDYEHIFNNEKLQRIYQGFFEIEGIREQIASYLEQALIKKRADSFVIEGVDNENCIMFAKAMARAMHELELYDSSRIAKISASKLNSIELVNQYERLRDSFVVIERASELSEKTMRDIMVMLEELAGHMVITLIDQKEKMDALFDEYQEFALYFTSRIALVCGTKEDLMKVALNLFNEAEFELEEEAIVCLETACNQIAVTVIEQERLNSLTKLIEGVIERAEERNLHDITLSQGVIDYKDSQINKIIAEDF